MGVPAADADSRMRDWDFPSLRARRGGAVSPLRGGAPETGASWTADSPFSFSFSLSCSFTLSLSFSFSARATSLSGRMRSAMEAFLGRPSWVVSVLEPLLFLSVKKSPSFRLSVFVGAGQGLELAGTTSWTVIASSSCFFLYKETHHIKYIHKVYKSNLNPSIKILEVNLNLRYSQYIQRKHFLCEELFNPFIHPSHVIKNFIFTLKYCLLMITHNTDRYFHHWSCNSCWRTTCIICNFTLHNSHLCKTHTLWHECFSVLYECIFVWISPTIMLSGTQLLSNIQWVGRFVFCMRNGNKITDFCQCR